MEKKKKLKTKQSTNGAPEKGKIRDVLSRYYNKLHKDIPNILKMGWITRWYTTLSIDPPYHNNAFTLKCQKVREDNFKHY